MSKNKISKNKLALIWLIIAIILFTIGFIKYFYS